MIFPERALRPTSSREASSTRPFSLHPVAAASAPRLRVALERRGDARDPVHARRGVVVGDRDDVAARRFESAVPVRPHWPPAPISTTRSTKRLWPFASTAQAGAAWLRPRDGRPRAPRQAAASVRATRRRQPLPDRRDGGGKSEPARRFSSLAHLHSRRSDILQTAAPYSPRGCSRGALLGNRS